MQNMFAEATPWHTPWMARVLPVVEEIAGRHPERTVFTHFIPPERAEDMPGSWQRYFRRWAEMTRAAIEPDLLDLVPTLARLVPPATVIDKQVLFAVCRARVIALVARAPGRGAGHHRGRNRCLRSGRGAWRGRFCYRVILAPDALCSSSDATHDALLTLYRESFRQQIEAADSAIILSSWNV